MGHWMEREIGEQPTILRSNADRYREEMASKLRNYRPELILLAARGSSDHAALYARYLFEVHLRIPVCLVAPSVLTRYGAELRYPRSLAIGVSQSGAAPDVAEMLAQVRRAGHLTIGITNTPGSRLEETADATLLLDAGAERSIAATKTFTASLMALYQVARALGADLPEPQFPDQAWLAQCEEAADQARGAVLRGSPVFSLARGYRYACAHELALKLMECALVACKAYSTADFEHGPKALLDHSATVVAFGGGIEAKLGNIVRSPVYVGTEEMAPWWEIIFGQYLALSCARALNLDPDSVPQLSKVTETL